jgi:phosphate acyltransferase
MGVRIAVDAMGGDHAPAAVIDGALRAAEQVGVALVGPKERIEQELSTRGNVSDNISVIDAPEVIEMGESPASAVKMKTRSSIHIGLGMHRDGMADAFVSAGNTGAVMAASLFILGRAQGVSRPAVIGYFPSPKGVSIVLDVGTNVDCKPEHLQQFARMGSIYARGVLGRPNPRVGLLNVGEEPGKGNDLVKAAYPLLENDPQIEFAGNIEGRDILMGAADVVVCDGFVGNVLLKFGESVASVLPMFIGAEVKKNPVPQEHLASFQQIFGGVKKHFDYEEFGGAPLLGVKGTVLIGHGGSSARAIEKMILTAASAARENVAGSIAEAFSA